MKIFTLTVIFGLLSSVLFSQNFIEDSVILGNSAANQSFYSLSDGEKVNISNTNWDLQIYLSAFSASIRPNGGSGTQLYELVQSDTSQWSSVDTTGMFPLYNSDTSWEESAFNQLSSGHPDYGWGLYQSMGTLVGKKIFVMQLSDGTFKKIWIKKLDNGIIYDVLTGNLDNSGESSFSISKSDYSGKSFVYYSIINNTVLDIEPAAAEWDIVFRQYLAEISPMTYYPVVGALTNISVQTVEARGIPIEDASDAGNQYSENIGLIGWDWKSFNNMTFTYDIEDSLSYFVKDQAGDIYHVAFSAYGGMADGKINFSKKKLSTVGINSIEDQNISDLGTYPNPAVSSTNIFFQAKERSLYSVSIIDITGQVIRSFNIQSLAGLNNFNLNTDDFSQGMYFIQLENEKGKTSTSRFVKQ